MTKEQFIAFFQVNYCDIEDLARSGSVSEVIDHIPTGARLITNNRLKGIIEEASSFGGEKFALFVEMTIGGNGAKLPMGKNRVIRYVWLSETSWEHYYEWWCRFEKNEENN